MLELTAEDLQHLLRSGSLNSEKLVDISLQQIESFDQNGPQLHAMKNVAPREKLLAQARQLDKERQEGQVRGPLHGIPIIVKVTMTAPVTFSATYYHGCLCRRGTRLQTCPMWYIC